MEVKQTCESALHWIKTKYDTWPRWGLFVAGVAVGWIIF